MSDKKPSSMDPEMVASPGPDSKAAPATSQASGWRARGPSLSSKLLLLTIVFVMLAEVLIFVPSAANFRVNWLMDRLAAARIASLAAYAAPDGFIPDMVREELLMNAQVKAISVRRDNKRMLILKAREPFTVAQHYDLTTAGVLTKLADGMMVFAHTEDRDIRVTGYTEGDPTKLIDIVVAEGPLRAAMIGFSLNILGLSIIISVITAALVYLALIALFVRPMRRITQSMVNFSSAPEDPTRIIQPSGRRDEIGRAEQELADMQHQLAETLHQRSRLAALGLAVSKINHDLRNMLANAQLISDRFGSVQDPTVQRFAPKLIGSLDRAIRLCADTLRYGRAQENPPVRTRFELEPLLEEVAEGLGLPQPGGAKWSLDVTHGLEVDGDRDQIFRILANVCRNALQALEGRSGGARDTDEIRLTARREGAVVTMLVQDTGPGVPERLKDKLFSAFQSSGRRGSTGLGLAIAAELVRLHGGDIQLEDSEVGAAFRIVVPDHVVELKRQRSAPAHPKRA